MDRRDIPIAFPCGADFSQMSPADRGRLCAACNTVVRDISSMTETEARAALASRGAERLCVRYLYDAEGRVAFGSDRDLARAEIIPDHRLTARLKRQVAKLTLLAAPLVLFEACGGNMGDYDHATGEPYAEPREAAAPEIVGDAGSDAPADASVDADPDADPGAPLDAGADAAPDAN